MVFSKKWLRNHPKFLLHFLIDIDVLMLFRKFELIPTSIFQVTAIFKNGPNFEKYPRLIFQGPWPTPISTPNNYYIYNFCLNFFIISLSCSSILSCCFIKKELI